MSERRGLEQIAKLRARLVLEQEIDRHLSELVRAAGRRVYLLHGDRVMRESQIRNVLDVALTTTSHEVVTNFIRYQMGRSESDRAWLHSNFGQAVVSDLESKDGIVQKLTDKVTEAVCNSVREANRDEVAREARMRLLRLYLGYLNRWFHYGSKTRRWDDIKAVIEEGTEDVR